MLCVSNIWKGCILTQLLTRPIFFHIFCYLHNSVLYWNLLYYNLEKAHFIFYRTTKIINDSCSYSGGQLNQPTDNVPDGYTNYNAFYPYGVYPSLNNAHPFPSKVLFYHPRMPTNLSIVSTQCHISTQHLA